MTWQSAIFSSGIACLLLLSAGGASAAAISGRVAITSSKDSGGPKKSDSSDVVIWLEQTDAPIPPAASRQARITQKDKRFTPHILVIARGTTVDFPNLDPIFHNAFSNFNGQIFDLALYAPGSNRSVQFNRSGVVRIFCNIHPAMSAVIVVVPSTNFATTARDGSFTIPRVPPGEYRIHFFDERATPESLQQLTRPITVTDLEAVLPPLTVSEAGYLPAPHKNKYGRDYSAAAADEMPGSYSGIIK